MKPNRDLIKVNGVDVADHGLHTLKLPMYHAPRKRVARFEVPGRSGLLTIDRNAWEESERWPEFLYLGDDPDGATDFLLSARTVWFANQPDRLFDCSVIDGFEVANQIANAHKFAVLFRCGLAREFVPTVLTGTSFTIKNETPAIAYPRFEVTTTGAVTITIGGNEIGVTGISGTLIIDSELGIVTDGNGNAWPRFTGDLPKIKPGETVTITSTKSMTLKPNWRWPG